MKHLLLLSLFLLSTFVSFSQTEKEKQKIISETNVTFLHEFAKEKEKEAKANKAKALEIAKQKDWAITKTKDNRFMSLMKVVDGKPIYYTTFNVDAAISTRANYLHNGGGLGLNIEGQGMTAHVWDGGHARVTHQEYDGIGGTNRVSIGDSPLDLNYHSAHVTGTIVASGFEANAKGMAPQADAVSYQWDSDVAEATSEAANGMLLSNHSYGYVASGIPDDWFGQYGSDAVDWDNIMYNAPYYLMVVAAGNDGNDNSSNGDPLDGNSSYDKLSGHATAKNNLVVANANDAVINADGSLNSVVINSSSSEGPCDDYRIKPDITGNGTGLYSTYDNADDAYNSITGTSMASPNVTGTLLLLQQHYNNLNGNFMRAATLKGLALHTADDAGTAGPDAIFGWGLLNGKKAAETITKNGDETIISELTLNDGGTYTIDITSDGINDFEVSVSWTDPAGTQNNGTNSTTPALVNDLDVRITQGASTYYPYRLTSITTNDNSGDNIVDPYEKIIVGGASGTYTITVTHKGSLSGGSQDFSLIVTGKAGIPATPIANFIADDLNPIVSNRLVTFTDLSEKLPTSWAWTFSPATVTYEGGTDATSQNPQVTFNAVGLYTVTLVATNAEGNDTEVKTDYINVTATCSHCPSYGNMDYQTSTTRVIFNTIDNSSGKTIYSDYTAQSTNVTALNSYDLTVNVNTDGAYRAGTKVWIDWNQDCHFDGPNEEYNLGTAIDETNGATTLSPLSVTVPATALAGSTIMRVSTQYDVAPGSCDIGYDGEVEDYTINVTALATPAISAVTPNSGVIFKDGGKDIIITGADLENVISVTVGGVDAHIITQTATQIDIELGGGNYSGNDIVVATATTSDTEATTFTYNTRNTIPVGGGTDGHSMFQWGLDGLFGWWGTTVFDATKTIEVYGGTYTETIVPNSTLAPTTTNRLVIQNHSGETPVVDASSNNYGFNIDLRYTTLTGFTVHSATLDNIFIQNQDNIVSYNKSYSAGESGINASFNTYIKNNLCYSNTDYGIKILISDAANVENNTCYDNGHNTSTVTGATDVQLFYEKWETGVYTGWTISGGTWNIQDEDENSYSPTHFARYTTSSNNSQIEGIMTYSSVDITNYDNINIECYVKEIGTMESADFLKGEYQLGTGSWTPFFTITDDNNSYTMQEVLNISTSSFSETILNIRFTASVNKTSEFWCVEDIKVTGDEPDTPASFASAAFFIESGTGTTVENNIFVAKTGTNYVAMETASGITVVSDYNTYYADIPTNNDNLVKVNGNSYSDLSSWATGETVDPGAGDIETNPDFVNAGTDFHIKSTNGSYAGGSWPPTTAFGGTWTTDGSDSPALDAGNPTDAFANEPSGGTAINQGAYGNTVQASKSAGLLWDGSTDNDWFTTTNWTPETVPTSTDDIIIPDGMPNYPVIDIGLPSTALCNNMTIAANASVTIATDGEMTVSGTITNNAGATGLIVKSDTNGDGSLIANNAVAATIERFVVGNQWHLMFPALSTIPTATYTVEGSNTNNNFYSFNELAEDYWDASTIYGTSGWTSEVATLNIPTDKGYMFNRYNMPDKTFVQTGGDIDVADKIFNVSYNVSAVAIANGVTEARKYFDGWNFSGNPYTSAVDWDLVTLNGIESGVYYYDGTNYLYYMKGGDGTQLPPYDIGISLNGGSQFVPSGQGFMVKVANVAVPVAGVDNINTTFTVPATARVHNNQAFYKKDKVVIPNLLRLQVEKDGYTDEMIIRTLPTDVTNEHDAKYDAYKMFAWDNSKPQIYSLSNDFKTNFAINSLPEITDNKVIPVGIYIGESGIYTISYTENNFENVDVYIHDIELDKFTLLKDNAYYSINLEAGNLKNRFELIFEKSSSSIADYSVNDITLYPNPNNGSFNLAVKNNAENYSVEVHNITGQTVYKNEFINSGTKEIQLNNQSAGVYFIKIIFDNNYTVNKKIIIQ